MSDFKHEHEAFLAGHNGTSFLEIGALTSIPCIGCFSREIILIFMLDLDGISKRRRFLLDFLTLVMPSAIAATLMSNHIVYICAFLLAVSLLAYWIGLKRNVMDLHSLHMANLSEQKLCIVWYRSIVNLMTAIAILAVDFPIFPRRLAKSETYGFGGMDNGVGFFVIANAIVSPEARGKHCQIPVFIQLKHSFKGCIPIMLLGFVRLIAVKGTDYHEHVTEYGVHWNFFFTLAALRLMSTLLYCLICVDQSMLIGLAITVLQQLLLSLCGLSNYIINGSEGTGSRVGIFDANREGILSIPGYLAIYLFGVAIGQFFFEKRFVF
ncbi:hypothetical protein EGW08_004051 [Elysia chlorotica]|uniref:Phosphatidylinositol-glycan biosynthesis class W protein n=1 Tax=Elysia chlorotica TaxID=188477 RepID=A0A3S1BH61_ELYCH|nr:hypothetical protein EGW08_004051 [Elysia chlorotica]